VSVEPQNRTQFSANGTKRGRKQKTRSEFCTSVNTWNSGTEAGGTGICKRTVLICRKYEQNPKKLMNESFEIF